MVIFIVSCGRYFFINGYYDVFNLTKPGCRSANDFVLLLSFCLFFNFLLTTVLHFHAFLLIWRQFYGDLVSVDPDLRELRNSALHEEELVTLSSREPAEMPSRTSGSKNSSSTQLIISESPEAAIKTPPVPTEVSRTTVEEPSGRSGGLQLSKNTGQNGMSIFQGYCFVLN